DNVARFNRDILFKIASQKGIDVGLLEFILRWGLRIGSGAGTRDGPGGGFGVAGPNAVKNKGGGSIGWTESACDRDQLEQRRPSLDGVDARRVDRALNEKPAVDLFHDD